MYICIFEFFYDSNDEQRWGFLLGDDGKNAIRPNWEHVVGLTHAMEWPSYPIQQSIQDRYKRERHPRMVWVIGREHPQDLPLMLWIHHEDWVMLVSLSSLIPFSSRMKHPVSCAISCKRWISRRIFFLPSSFCDSVSLGIFFDYLMESNLSPCSIVL